MPGDKTGRLTYRLAEARAAVEGALEEILGTLHPILLRYALARLSRVDEPAQLAHDLTHDALIAIIDNLQMCQASTDSQLIAWALSILQNRINDHFRAALKARRIRFELTVVPLHDESSGADVTLDRDLIRGRRVLRRIVRDVVDELPPSRLHLLRLRVNDGTQWRQIAAEFGIGRDAARRRFHRLQAFLRKAILKRVAGLAPRERKAALKAIREDPP
jgi:RNA polymerase sigma factor (sigma-70 family)